MRPHLPSIPENQHIGAGPWNVIAVNQSHHWAGDPDILWEREIRKVRIGGTDYHFTNATQAGKDSALQYVARGFYVEWGMTWVNRTGNIAGKFGTEDMAEYLDKAVEFAQWAEENGLGAFMLQNEMGQTSILDVNTLSIANFELWIRDVVAPACRAVAPTIDLVINETANRIAAWGALGRGSANIKRGFNIYGGSVTDLAGFTAQVNSIKALGDDAYVSEWNIYFTWDANPTIPQTVGLFDQVLQKKYVAERLAVINASGMDHYFFTFKRTNTNDPGDWNAFAASYSIGTPNNVSDIFLNRKMFYALFPEREPVGGLTQRWLNFNGSAYAILPMVPSGAGIGIMFWYNRQEYGTTEKYIIGNNNPTHSFLNSFRLYHDPPTSNNPAQNRDILLNTFNESGSGGFNKINALSAGDDQHIAVIITPGLLTAALYINGVRQGFLLPGFIGDPIDFMTIGARTGDFFGRGKFRMRDLVVKNSPNGWNLETVLAHMNTGAIPAGSSYYDFDIDATDQSGNGFDLELHDTGWYDEDMPGPRPVSDDRPVSGDRTDTP